MPFALAGRVTNEQSPKLALEPPPYFSTYAAIDTEPYPARAIHLKLVKPEFLRREISYRPGTIVVDPAARYAYLVLENGRALRYGFGVGAEEALNFCGEATIVRKAEWLVCLLDLPIDKLDDPLLRDRSPSRIGHIRRCIEW